MKPEDIVGQLFKGSRQEFLGPGSIVSFFYVGQSRLLIHDPTPLVLVSRTQGMLKGVNLHYLTYPSLSKALNFGRNFSYVGQVRGDIFFKDAFRSYRWNGVTRLRQLDADYLRTLLTVTRSLDPNELEKLSLQVKNLLNAPSKQPSATEVSGG